MIFLPEFVKPYAKMILPVLAFLVVAVTAVSDGTVDTEEVKALVAGVTVLAGVYFPRNAPKV